MEIKNSIVQHAYQPPSQSEIEKSNLKSLKEDRKADTDIKINENQRAYEPNKGQKVDIFI